MTNTLKTFTITTLAEDADEAALRLALVALTASIAPRTTRENLVSYENGVFVMVSVDDVAEEIESLATIDMPWSKDDFPNFCHKPSGLKVYLGHYWDDAFTIVNPTNADIPAVLQACFAALAEDQELAARRNARLAA